MARKRKRKSAGVELKEHFLVPKFSLLSDNQKEDLSKKYDVTLQQLPKILLTDPMTKFLNAKIGDIIKIERDSPTAGKAIFFRCVVNG